VYSLPCVTRCTCTVCLRASLPKTSMCQPSAFGSWVQITSFVSVSAAMIGKSYNTRVLHVSSRHAPTKHKYVFLFQRKPHAQQVQMHIVSNCIVWSLLSRSASIGFIYIYIKICNPLVLGCGHRAGEKPRRATPRPSSCR
jgi:hypothetical protein